MAEVNAALTQKVAELARLELSDEEVQRFTSQLGDILKYVETLNEVDTEGVDPLGTPIEMASQYREDEIEVFPSEGGKPKILKHAPDVLYDGYKVPPII